MLKLCVRGQLAHHIPSLLLFLVLSLFLPRPQLTLLKSGAAAFQRPHEPTFAHIYKLPGFIEVRDVKSLSLSWALAYKTMVANLIFFFFCPDH